MTQHHRARATTAAIGALLATAAALGAAPDENEVMEDCITATLLPKFGFPHAEPGHLPSNARGALFLVDLLEPFIIHTDVMGDDSKTLLLSQVPPIVGPHMFRITVPGKLLELPGAVERVRLNDIQGRYFGVSYKKFLVTDKKLRSCLDQTIWPPCDTEDLDLLQQKRFEDLVTKHRIRDVTTETAGASGIFLVGPRDGFKKGERYTITYTDKQDREQTEYRYPRQIKLTIDGPLRMRADDRITFEATDEPRRGVTWAYTGGNCPIMGIEQSFRYALPDKYLPYRDELAYLVEVKPLPGVLTHAGTELAYEPLQIPAEDRGVLDDEHQGIVTGCSDPGKPLVPGYSVRVKVGFLELSDKLNITPETEIRFSAASCSNPTE